MMPVSKAGEVRSAVLHGLAEILRMPEHVAPLPIPLAPLPARPLVSILMASYNHAPFVGAAIESVLRQTYQGFELIICDDGSGDTSGEVIGRYGQRDSRLTLIRQENRGAAAAVNTAYRHARGDILCILDSDDMFAVDKLETVVECLSRRDAGFLHHAMTTVDALGNPLSIMPGFGGLEQGWLAPKLLRRGGRWLTQPSSALCLRKECGVYAFPIPAQMKSFGYDAFVQTLVPLLTPVAAIDTPLACYRIHGGNQLHGRRVDAAVLERMLQLEVSVCDLVNERLREKGFGSCQLDGTRNLHLQEQRFALRLLGGETPRRQLARALVPLAHGTLADDMLGPYGKARTLLTFIVAILLPIGRRSGWLQQLFEPTSRLRQAVHTVRGGVRKVLRVARKVGERRKKRTAPTRDAP